MSHKIIPGLPVNTVPWYKRRYLLKLNFVIFSLAMYSSTVGYDGSIMSSLLALNTWNSFMGTPTGVYLGWINACYFLANAVALPIMSWISGKYGRKRPMYIGYIFIVMGVAVQASAQTEKAFTYGRLPLGVASAAFSVSAPVIINEIALPQHRSIASALYNCGYYIGGTLSSWITFGTRSIDNDWSWRIPVLMQLFWPLVALVGLTMCPESPRWLISVGRVDEATQVLADSHAGGDRENALVTYQMNEIEAAITAEKDASASASYIDMVKTPGNRHRLFISVTLGIFSQWAGNGVVSYYLPLMLNTVGIRTVTQQTLITACLNIWNFCWAVAAAFNVDRLGRRFLFLTSAIVMLVSFTIITGLSGSFATNPSYSVGISVIPFLFIFFAGYDVALTPLLTSYSCEIWQFSLRSRGLAVTWVSAFCALFFNVFINAIALEAIAWRYYIVFIVILIIFLITAFFAYPETRGYTLEQMAVIFDGPSAALSVSEMGLEKSEVIYSP